VEAKVRTINEKIGEAAAQVNRLFSFIIKAMPLPQSHGGARFLFIKCV